MRSTRSWLLPALLGGLGALALAGCEAPAGHEGPTTQPQTLSNVQPGRPIDAPTISPEMERYDPGIGDTATGTGGGHSINR